MLVRDMPQFGDYRRGCDTEEGCAKNRRESEEVAQTDAAERGMRYAPRKRDHSFYHNETAYDAACRACQNACQKGVSEELVSESVCEFGDSVDHGLPPLLPPLCPHPQCTLSPSAESAASPSGAEWSCNTLCASPCAIRSTGHLYVFRIMSPVISAV